MAWPAWRSSSWRVVGCSAGSGSALRGGALRCRGQQPRAVPPLSPSARLSAAAIAIVSVDTTVHAACFGAGLLRITLCSPNSCCWSLSSSGLTKGGHMSWNTTTSAACYSICRKKLRGGPPNPVLKLLQLCVYQSWSTVPYSTHGRRTHVTQIRLEPAGPRHPTILW